MQSIFAINNQFLQSIEGSSELSFIFVERVEFLTMTRPANWNLLEHQRVLKLAREYRREGYQVTLYPEPNELPSSLADCSLDLVATKDQQAIAAKVRTRKTLTHNGSEDLRRITESIHNIPGWEFELVVTNARKKSNSDALQ